MGFLKRLLSVGGKKNRKDSQKGSSKRNALISGSTPPIPQGQDVVDQDVLFNRLLRSSSTHFSVISEGTEYRSMPPIPHPINNVLRAPSIISNATQADTYTVKVHRRMLHSRTEFPNANRSNDSSSSPAGSLSRRHSLPLSPLTPGDKNRLANLRQDASVLSLLDIYDEKGNPNLKAFSNTPAKSERHDPSLRALMGTPSTPNMYAAETGLEESDISWADRYIRAARRDSSSSSLTASSLGIPVNLFKSSLSPGHLRLQDHDSETPFSSCEIDANIDSMLVERGTVEDSSAVLQPVVAAELTSPSRRASQFFKFLQDDPKHNEQQLPPLPNATAMISREDPISAPLSQPSTKPVPPPRGPRPIQRGLSLAAPTTESAVDKARLSRRDTDVLFVRDGPKQNHAQVSPPPRRHPRPPPLPPIPTRHDSHVATPQPLKSNTAAPRSPFEELRNADAHDASSRNTPPAPASRSVSVASSVHPWIETQAPDCVADPYTPVPRRPSDGKRGHYAVGENIPPNAPARPVRNQNRPQTNRNGTKSKENVVRQAPASSKPVQPVNEKTIRNIDPSIIPTRKELPLSFRTTPPATPPKNPAYAYLQTASRPSPASSTELSPHGRQIMANLRESARKGASNKTPRSWQSWTDKSEPAAV